MTAVARNELPRGLAAPGTCALPQALSQYLGAIEARAGAAPGTLPAAAVFDALRALPIGAIRCEASGDDPFFAAGDPLDPCPVCERLLDNRAAKAWPGTGSSRAKIRSRKSVPGPRST